MQPTAAPAPQQLASSQPLIPAFRLGQHYAEHGGIFAGIVYDADGTPTHQLFIGPEAESLDWDAAIAWAAALDVDGHKDFALPTRAEQRVLFANTKSHFQPAWYWSGEQHASGSYCAWGQYFDDGYQNCSYKVYQGRARAVRRLLIQQFGNSVLFFI